METLLHAVFHAEEMHSSAGAEKAAVLKGRGFSHAAKPMESRRLVGMGFSPSSPPRECFRGNFDFFSTLSSVILFVRIIRNLCPISADRT